VLLNQRLWGTTFFRALFFLPVVIGSSSVMTQLDTHGGVPIIVMGRFLTGITTAVGPQLANFVIFIYQGLALMLWKSGVQVLLFLAGLFSVPSTYYEVARIDGASGWQTFLKVTLPSLSPMILLVTIYTLVDSFTNRQLNPLLGYIIGLQSKAGTAFYSEASAMGWIYFVVVFVILVLILGYARNHVYYAGER
jgi:ABC-type sugar transport system permease subunit